MEPAYKKGRPKTVPGRQSEVRQKPSARKGERTRRIGDVTLKEVFPYATEMAFEKVDEALEAARDKLGIVFSTNGQTIMFPGYNDEEKEIPAEKVSEFSDFMQKKLRESNIQVTRSGTQVLLSMGISDDPAEEQGYRKR